MTGRKMDHNMPNHVQFQGACSGHLGLALRSLSCCFCCVPGCCSTFVCEARLLNRIRNPSFQIFKQRDGDGETDRQTNQATDPGHMRSSLQQL